MGYIYKIYSSNIKEIYIGQTKQTIEDRWRQHKYQAYIKLKDFELYKAMREFSFNSFKIEIIEEVEDEKLYEREEYWIKYYNAFSDGLNMNYCKNLRQFDYKAIVDYYNNEGGKSIIYTARGIGCSKGVVYNALKEYNVPLNGKNETNSRGIPIKQIDIKTGEVIKIWSSANKVCNELHFSSSKSIGDVCKGRSKTAYGYKWEYV